MTLDSIIERLEKAECGDREIDASIAVQIVGMIKTNRLADYPDCQPLWGFTDGSTEGSAEVMVPRYTSSVDAAIELAEKVLPGWNFTLSSRQAFVRRPWADVASDAWIEDNNKSEYAEASGVTLPIAMCIAILKAKQMGVGE